MNLLNNYLLNIKILDKCLIKKMSYMNRQTKLNNLKKILQMILILMPDYALKNGKCDLIAYK